MRTPGLALSLLAALPLALGALVALPSPAHAADTDVVVNEVATSGGIPGDWIELKNTGGTPVPLDSYVLKDSNNGNTLTIPAGTTISAGGYLTFDVEVSFGLSGNDEARLFKPDGTTLIDGVSWTVAPNTTWARCPDGAGPGGASLSNLEVGSKGLPNACTLAGSFPGGAAVSTADTAGSFGGNMSGLAYEGSGSTAPGTIWAVKNDPGTLYKVTKSGATWGAAATWDLNYTTGVGNPDSEGVTITDAGAAGGVYVATERDGGGGTRPAILRFVPSGSGGALTATNDWNLSADLPGLDANSGLEAVAWVPDTYLTSRGFVKDAGGAYNPADYPGHGDGLFFVGVEQTGQVIGYALNHANNTFTRVVTIQKFLSTVTDLVFDPAMNEIWAECDNNCGGRIAQVDIDVVGPNQGHFSPDDTYERPTGMPNLNNEGFTLSSRTECVGGVKPVFWADDGNTGGNALRTGTVSCTPGAGPTITAVASSSKPKTAAGWYAAPVTVTFTCTPGSSPISGGCPTPAALTTSGANQSVSKTIHNYDFATATATVNGINIDPVAPTVKIRGVKKGKTYSGKKKPKCAGTDALSGIASCVVKQKKKGSKYKVTATATDKAGNVTVATLTYKVKPKKK